MIPADVELIKKLSTNTLNALLDVLMSAECPVQKSRNCPSCPLFDYPQCITAIMREELSKR